METVIKGLVASKQLDKAVNKFVNSVFTPVAESGCIDPCEVKGFDPCKVKGISLFVELTGGMTKKRDCETTRDAGQHEFRVNVGDLVWVVIKKQKKSSWWPAVVCDGSNAPKEDDCLVRCFGNGSYIWCSDCDVKPFVGYFDRLPSQSKAKKFLDALDEAVVELGDRVKTEFTCSCFHKVKIGKDGTLGDLFVTRFEPAKFLDYIKDLARVIDVPNRIDYVVKRNCLSAFYRSLGHLQMPMHQLTLTFGSQLKVKAEEENGYFSDDLEKSEKPFGQSQPVKKPRKKWSRKNKGLQANVCSSEVLLQLQYAAQDCVFPCESKNFDFIKGFISRFRKRVFNESSNNDMLNHKGLQEKIPKKAKRKDKSVISPTLRNDSVIGSLITYFQNVMSLNLEAQSKQGTFFNLGKQPMTQQPLCNLKPKRHKKNAENFTSMHAWNADLSNFMNTFGSTPQVGLGPTGSLHVPKKRGRKKKNKNLQANPGSTVIPDFTQNHGEPQVGPKKRGRKRKNIVLQANPGSTIIPKLNEIVTGNETENIKKIKEVGVQCINLSYNKVEQDSLKEVKGIAFLLKFSPDHPLPSNQDLNSVFSKYGELVESETQVLSENLSGQVVFLDSCSAGGAFWGLQNDKLFGPVLVNYKIQHLSGDESMVQFKTPIKCLLGSKPMIQSLNTNLTEVQIMKRSKTVEEIRLPSMDLEGIKKNLVKFEQSPVTIPVKLKPCQDIEGIKKNLEMMNLMLMKAGDSLSQEMKGKLESEIKGLMNKVNVMDGCSSSSLVYDWWMVVVKDFEMWVLFVVMVFCLSLRLFMV